MKMDRKYLVRTGQHLRNLREQDRDRMSAAALEKVDRVLADIGAAADSGGTVAEEKVRNLVDAAGKVHAQAFPKPRHPQIAEYVDMVLVAAVVALGIRAYFLQPFKIPTNSMFPTLRGVVARPLAADEKVPAWPQRIAERLFFGRDYVDERLPAGTVFTGVRTTGILMFRSVQLLFQRGPETWRITVGTEGTPGEILDGIGMPLRPGARLDGDVHLRAIIDPGDHLFVNKVLYNFRRPKRGETFVFRTTGLPTQHNLADPQSGGQYYIKRCVGVPGDELRVESPRLLVNGREAEEPTMRRVWEAAGPGSAYRGYGAMDRFGLSPRYLGSSAGSVALPQDAYWAMGDNSYNSLDSRYFGPVPLKNVVGRALIIYYPFNRKFWLID